MITPTWIHVFLDVPRAEWEESVRFWAAATATTPSAPRGDDGQFLTLMPAAGSSWVKLQAVDGAPRLHLDLDTADGPALLQRALELGAASAWQYRDVPVLRSPGGLLFCITLAEGEDDMVRDGGPVLDQVCLDIPARLWTSEVVFWRDLTGREITSGRADHFARLVDPDPAGPVRFLLQRLGTDQAAVTAHPDLAVADRPAEVARRTALGAVLVAEHSAWTTLRAQDGLAYCITDRDPRTGIVAG